MYSNYNLTDNGTAGPVTVSGGSVHVQLEGDIGGGDAAIRLNMGSGFVTDTTLTEVDAKVFDVPQGSQAEVVLSGASSPDLNVSFHH